METIEALILGQVLGFLIALATAVTNAYVYLSSKSERDLFQSAAQALSGQAESSIRQTEVVVAKFEEMADNRRREHDSLMEAFSMTHDLLGSVLNEMQQQVRDIIDLLRRRGEED
jgi:uncharacterized protein YoxC